MEVAGSCVAISPGSIGPAAGASCSSGVLPLPSRTANPPPTPSPPRPRPHLTPPRIRFYDASAKIGMMEAFKKLAVGPDELPDIIFASVGRTIWKDVGGVALGFRWGGGRGGWPMSCPCR
jgi:hypothetical protein